MEENKIEIWKDIPNYEGLYQASNFGRIRALTFHNNICYKKKILVLKQQIDRYGRKRIKLNKGKKSKLFQVHKLIAETFLNKNNFKYYNEKDKQKYSNNLEKLEINHKDENPLNNNVNNLEFCTHNYNMHYGNIEIKKILGKGYKKVNQYDLKGNYIKTWNKVLDITKSMGISKQSISSCCSGKTKTANNYIWRYINE